MTEGWWAERHNAVLQRIAGEHDAELLLIGDSITNNYDKSQPPDEDFQPTWRQFYAPRKALNLGFSSDTTSHVLWRLEHGEVKGLRPKAVVLLIGTNNTGWKAQSAEETQAGIDAVVADLENRLPESRILLLGLLPSAVSEDKTVRDRAVNNYLARAYEANPRVSYLDIGSVLTRLDGQVDANLFYDPRLPKPGKPLHPNTVGQRRMAEAIEPTLAKLMGEKPRVPLAEMTDVNTALIPVSKLEQDSYDWFARHRAELLLGRQVDPEVVLIGDSITHFWGGIPLARQVNGPGAWDSVFAGWRVLNLGFGWDRTQNLLWRLREGELDGLHPRWIVILIGTNNLTGTENARASTPAETAAGVAAVYEDAHRRSPESKVIVMGVLPRGPNRDSPLRAAIAETNRLLQERFGTDPNVTYLDIGARFLRPDGTLPIELMPDGTHPSDAGYRIWAEALKVTGLRR